MTQRLQNRGAAVCRRRTPRFLGASLAAGCLLVAACSAAPPRPASPPAGVMRATAPPAPAVGQAPGTVAVVLDDVPPGRQIDAVALIDPRGGRHPAATLIAGRRESGAASGSNPTIGIGVTGGSASGINPVIGLSLSLFGDGAGAGDSRRRVTAQVPLGADAPAESFAGWRIAVSVTEVTGERRVLELPLGAARVP